MWSMVAGFQNAAPFVTERYHALASRHPSVAPTYHARIVRAVQVCTHEYMQMVAHNIADGVIGVEVPNFTVMLQELKRGTFHNSTNWVDIPEAYLDPVPPQRSMTGSSAGGEWFHHHNGDTTSVPWLLAAPPWAATTARLNDLGTEVGVGDGATRKRRADQISEAEAALGKLAVVTEKLFATHGWVRTVALARGKSDITPTVGQLSHRAARLLTHLKKRGATVPVHTPAWPIERRDGAVTRGAHRSSAGERQFVCEEMLDFVPKDIGS
ncbi:hypothetical protein MHU86_22072 [Fragilaria crotonensis]|nr:hypothetical protein MHU86_22072 [Fragilaria crotonensis]